MARKVGQIITVEALQERGLIRATKGRDPLSIVWRLSKK